MAQDTTMRVRQRIEGRDRIPQETKQFIWRECGKKCAHCGRPMDYVQDFTLEHAIPLSKGGTNDLVNLVALCEDCNKEKGNDIIPPMEYFPYLPQRRKNELQALFSKYLDSFDWLERNNLFMTDWFDVDFIKYLPHPSRRKTICLHDTAQVVHISTEEAFRRIQAYTKQLDRPDQAVMAKTIDDVKQAFYSISLKGQEIAFFSATMETYEQTKDIDLKDWDYFIYIDWFNSFEVPYRYGIEATIESLMEAVLDKIQSTLLHGSQNTAIPVCFRMPESAPFAIGIHEIAGSSLKEGCIEKSIGVMKESMYEGHVLYHTYILSQAKAKHKNAIGIVRKEDDRYYLNGEEVYPKELQKDIVRRLEHRTE